MTEAHQKKAPKNYDLLCLEPKIFSFFLFLAAQQSIQTDSDSEIDITTLWEGRQAEKKEQNIYLYIRQKNR